MCGLREGGLDWVASNPTLEKQNGKEIIVVLLVKNIGELSGQVHYCHFYFVPLLQYHF